jgi:hypothetical protein
MKSNHKTICWSMAGQVLMSVAAVAANYEVIPYKAIPEQTIGGRGVYQDVAMVLDNTKGTLFVCTLSLIVASSPPGGPVLPPQMQYNCVKQNHTSVLPIPSDLATSLFSPSANTLFAASGTFWQIDPVKGDLQACSFGNAIGINPDCIMVNYPH